MDDTGILRYRLDARYHHDTKRENRDCRVDAGRLHPDDTAVGDGGEDRVHQDLGRASTCIDSDHRKLGPPG